MEVSRNKFQRSDRAVIVFLKNSVAGKVKTRVAASTSDAEALEIYNHLCNITFEMLANLNVTVYLFYSDYIPNLASWYAMHIQQGKDLGERMHNAICKIHISAQNIILIGSDCPYIESKDLINAFEDLDHHDLVIGPTDDGGYYLIGMKTDQPELFDNMPWSTSSVFERTLNTAHSLALKVKILEKYSDIDTIEDWIKYTAFCTEKRDMKINSNSNQGDPPI